MRKLYSYLAALFLCSLSTNTFAQLPTENAILEGSEFNMRLYKDVDFGALTINGEPMAETAINFDADQTTDEIKYNGYFPYRCSNEGLSNVWVATSTPNWNADRGLITNGSGPRGFLLSDMVAGQIIVLQGKNGGYNTGETNAEYNGFCVPTATRQIGNGYSLILSRLRTSLTKFTLHKIKLQVNCQKDRQLTTITSTSVL